MPLYHAPRRFAMQLHAFDPLLRCVYDDKHSHFRIERKVTHGKTPSPSKFCSQSEYECARDGYTLVMRVRQNQLDERVFYTLWASDLQRHGGAQAVADHLDAIDSAKGVQQREAFLDYVDQGAREMFRYGNTVRTNPEHMPHLGKDLSIVAGSV